MRATNRVTALTARTIEGLIAQARTTGEEWANDASQRGVPKLQVRAKADERGDVSVNFYLRYVLSDGNRDRLPLGPYDGAGKAGLTLAQARTKADDLRRIYRDVSKDLRDHLEAQQKAAEARAESAARQARDFNLGELLRAYVRYLGVPEYLIERIDVPVKRGERTPAPEGASAAGMRQSGRDVLNNFRRYVFLPYPELVKRPAASITTADLHAVVAAVVKATEGRAAVKLRSYLRAAFQSALNAEFDPSAPTALMGFGLTGNPAAGLAAMSQFNRALDRTLKEPELRAYMARIAKVTSPIARAALELSLFLGGQRPAQLLRVTGKDVDLDAMTVRLEDPKGRRRGTPRQHVLPLTERTAPLLSKLIGLNGDGFVFSSDGGKTAMRPETLSVYVSEIASEMIKAKEAAEDFDLRDIRRTAETMLARIGVSKDDRAQLLSHGLGGVQDRHYDKHDYDQQKRAALTRWEAHLDRIRDGRQDEKVVPMRRRKG
ncbi:MAG: tyrosine-type recombinase/integrase [Burkholderiales bacterium]|jgi:integrase